MPFQIVSNLNPVVVNMSGGFVGSITGNTSGTPAVVSSGTMYLAGGNNVTLSQNGNTIEINGGAGGTGGAADGFNRISAGTQQAGTNQTVAFSNSNNVSFGMSNNSIVTASASFPAQTQYVFSNSNGVSFGTNGSTVTASVRTDYQSAGAYLTTARASNDAIGLNTAGSNATFTANSSGLSIDGRGYAGTNTTFNGTNISGSMTVNSNGVNLALSGPAAGGGAGDGYNIIGVNGAGTQLSTTLQLSNSNNVSFGLNAGTITASASYSQSTQPVAASASNGSFAFSTLKFVETNGVTWASSTDGIRASVKTDYQSSNANYLTSQSNQAVSFTSGSQTFQTLSFTNSNGISFNSGTQGIFASHNGLTTARASNDAIGLNTAGTNVTWTVNSSGISLNAGAYLTTAMASNRGSDFVQATAAFAGTNASGTIASNGISVSVAAPGAAAENNWFNLIGNTGGTSTASGSTIALSGGNGVTLSGSNGSQIGIHVNTTPDQWYINGNTAGANSSYQWTNDALYLSGGANITLSQNGSTLGIIGAAGGGGAAGSDYFYEPYPLMNGNSTTWAPGLGTWHFEALKLPVNLASGRLNLFVSMGSTSNLLAASNGTSWVSNTTGGISQSFVLSRTVAIYQRGSGTNSTRLESVWSNTRSDGVSQSVGVSLTNASQLTVQRQVSLQYVQSVETNGLYTTAGLGATHNASFGNSSTNTSAATSAISSIMNIMSGAMLVPIGFNTTLSAGDYWVGMAYSTASTTAGTSVNGASIWPQVNQMGQYVMASMSHRLFGQTVSNTSSQYMPGHGAIYSAASSVPPAVIPFTDLRSVASHVIPYINIIQSVAS